MSLSKKELSAVINDPVAFYLYKDKADSNDLIKIFDIPRNSYPAFWLLPIIKTIKENNLDILTDDVIYKILEKGCSLGVMQGIADIFRKYFPKIPDAVVNKLILDKCESGKSISDTEMDIRTIVECLNPKIMDETVLKYMIPLFAHDDKILNYILNQLIADKKHSLILSQKALFDYTLKTKSKFAKQLVKEALDTKQLDFIAKCSKEYSAWKFGILFSDDLIEKMVDCCLKEHRTEMIFDIPKVFNYVNDRKPELAKSAIRQIFEVQNNLYFSPNFLSCVIKHEPDLVKKIAFKQIAMKHVKKEESLDLLNLMPLPNTDVEFAYIERNNRVNTIFPAEEKLSPETLDYIEIIKGKNVDTAKFASLSPRTIEALINCDFYNRADWYKIMESLLIANPRLDVKYIQQMLNTDKKVSVLIKRHWKGGIKRSRIKNFLIQKKNSIMAFLGIKQNEH